MINYINYSELYVRSVCDVTGRSSFPTRTEGAATFWRSGGAESHNNATDAQKECGGGFLTYLFEADDSFNLDLGIAYALSGMIIKHISNSSFVT